MGTFGRFLGRIGLLLGLVLGGVWFFGPREAVSVVSTFDPTVIGPDVVAYLAEREAPHAGMTPGVEKRVIWAGAAGERTETGIVYVHGFSATSEELRPVPDMVASKLGANLVYTRLAGHGLAGERLAEARAEDWINDVAEAIAVARKISDQVIVIATSTGATLAAEVALQDAVVQDVAGMILVSPNFAIADRAATVLTWPAARYWVPRLVGATRNWPPANAGHAQFWTYSYPTAALFQMAALVEHAQAQDYGRVEIPVLFWFSDADQVVDHRATRAVAAAWGGPVSLRAVTVSEGGDPASHVIAGDILSPGQTRITADAFAFWINEL